MRRCKIVIAVTVGMLMLTSCQTTSRQEAPLPTFEEVKEKMHLGEPLTDADKKVLAEYYNNQ